MRQGGCDVMRLETTPPQARALKDRTQLVVKRNGMARRTGTKLGELGEKGLCCCARRIGVGEGREVPMAASRGDRSKRTCAYSMPE